MDELVKIDAEVLSIARSSNKVSVFSPFSRLLTAIPVPAASPEG